jgi:hypothetical protein
MSTINIGFTAGITQLQASRGLFSVEAVGQTFNTSGSVGGPLSISTPSLPNAVVGQSYNVTLSASGGVSPYSWTILSAAPNTDLWQQCINSALFGVPQMAESGPTVLLVTDSVGSTAQASFTLTVVASGALSIATPIGNYYNAISLAGGVFSLRMLAQGGAPPYTWALAGPAFTATGTATATVYAMSALGWLQGATAVGKTGTDALSIIVTDSAGATVTKTVNVTATSTLNFYPYDSVSGSLNLPDAYVGTTYSSQLRASGGVGPYTYTVVSGMPAGLSLSSAGVISGAATFSGSSNIVLQVHDSASAVTSGAAQINVLPKNIASRPAYNTGSGFFVDASGNFRDPNGYLYDFRGLNRNHYDSTPWTNKASGALANPGVARTFYFVINAQTTAQQMANALAQNINNGIVPVMVMAGFPGGGGTSGNGQGTPISTVSILNNTVTLNSNAGTNPFAGITAALALQPNGTTAVPVSITATGGSSGAWTVTTGTQISTGYNGGTLYDMASLSSGVAFWTSGVAAFVPYMGQIVVNIVNEWGPSNSQAWQYAYQSIVGNISAISGTTITVNTVSGTNPFQTCPFAYISGAGGITNQVVNLSNPAGSSGAWTVTSSVSLSGYTSGGTLNGGAVGALRGAGFTCPLLIDAGGSGQDPFDLLNYAAGIQSSDAQQNCFFGYHSYGDTLAYQCQVASVTTGNPTIITLNSSAPYHPFNPSNTGNGAYSGLNQFIITGAQGMTQLNGTFASPTNTYGSAGAWQLHLSTNSSAWTGSYVPNSATVTTYSTVASGAGGWDYRQLYAAFAALKSSGVSVAIMEFGPGNQTGNPAQINSGANPGPSYTNTTIGQVISAAEANGLPWCYWAWDDHNAAGAFTGWFAAVLGNNGVYTSPLSFTAAGLEVVANPRYGLWALSQQATSP